MNPGGEQLGTGQLPLPTFFVALLVTWSVVLVAWCLNWFKYRNERILLHRAITLIPLFKIIEVFYNLIYWSTYSKKGKVELWETVLYYATSVVFEGVLFTILLLISKGWGITRPNIIGVENRAITVTVVALILSFLCYKLLEGTYLFALLAMYIIILKFIFSNITYNSNALKSQLFLIRQQRSQNRTRALATDQENSE